MIQEDTSTRTQKFRQNAADFTKKNGMKICAGAFLLGNLVLMAEPIWAPEKYDFMRNTAAAWFQYAANSYQLKGKRDTAYDYAVVGGASHTIASAGQELYFGAVMWSLFTEAAYKASHWPQKIGSFAQKYLGFKKADDRPEKEAPKKKNAVSAFIENKFDLLKDPHARAGCVALVSNVGQAVEAVIKDNTQMMMVAPLWILAAGFYAGHGLLHARDKKRAATVTTKPA